MHANLMHADFTYTIFRNTPSSLAETFFSPLFTDKKPQLIVTIPLHLFTGEYIIGYISTVECRHHYLPHFYLSECSLHSLLHFFAMGNVACFISYIVSHG